MSQYLALKNLMELLFKAQFPLERYSDTVEQHNNHMTDTLQTNSYSKVT
jgi:hypothetical protein